MTIMQIATPRTTIRSVEPISDLSCCSGVGVVCKKNAAEEIALCVFDGGKWVSAALIKARNNPMPSVMRGRAIFFIDFVSITCGDSC